MVFLLMGPEVAAHEDTSLSNAGHIQYHKEVLSEKILAGKASPSWTQVRLSEISGHMSHMNWSRSHVLIPFQLHQWIRYWAHPPHHADWIL